MGKPFDMYAVVGKLIGPIEPVGETHTDTQRFENLEAAIELVDRLLFDIHEVSKNDTRHEASMSKAGKRARDFLADVRDSSGEWERKQPTND